MKAICNRGALLDALNLTGNVVAARTPNTIPWMVTDANVLRATTGPVVSSIISAI